MPLARGEKWCASELLLSAEFSPLFRRAMVPFSGKVVDGNVNASGVVASSVDASRAVENVVLLACEPLTRLLQSRIDSCTDS